MAGEVLERDDAGGGPPLVPSGGAGSQGCRPPRDKMTGSSRRVVVHFEGGQGRGKTMNWPGSGDMGRTASYINKITIIKI